MIRAYRNFPMPLRALSLLVATLAMLFASTAALAQTMASSVSQYGITWYFDREYQVGRYANGDWWVLGPATIINITPESVTVSGRTMNGSQINPVGSRHGYDSAAHGSTYSDSLNVAPSRTTQPIVLSTGSVVSSISLDPIPSGWHGGAPRITDLAILTIVSEVPPAGAFRPHPYGTDKTSYWTESQLNYGILRSLPAVSNLPDLTEARRQALRFWNEQAGGIWTQTAVQAVNNQPNYGSNLARRNGDLALMLHLDIPADAKREIFVGLVQYGLDIYGRILTGGSWWSDGGHNHGRKLPMLLAGLALNDSNILFYANRENGRGRFQENGSTFVVNQAQINNGHGNYTQSHLGVPEWGIRYWEFYNETTQVSVHTDSRYLSCNASWDAPYRYVGNQYMAHALATRLTNGGISAWNWQPFFDYTDRFNSLGRAPQYALSGFASEMWSAYRDLAPSSDPPSAPQAPTLSVD